MARERFRIVATPIVLFLAAFASANAYPSPPAIRSRMVTVSAVSAPRRLTVRPVLTDRAATPAPYKHLTKTIYLTFDDGPNPIWTSEILFLLEDSGAHASFFVIGENAKSWPKLVEREARDGDTIGDHTWSHPNLNSAVGDCRVGRVSPRPELDHRADRKAAQLVAPSLRGVQPTGSRHCIRVGDEDAAVERGYRRLAATRNRGHRVACDGGASQRDGRALSRRGRRYPKPNGGGGGHLDTRVAGGRVPARSPAGPGSGRVGRQAPRARHDHDWSVDLRFDIRAIDQPRQFIRSCDGRMPFSAAAPWQRSANALHPARALQHS